MIKKQIIILNMGIFIICMFTMYYILPITLDRKITKFSTVPPSIIPHSHLKLLFLNLNSPSQISPAPFPYLTNALDPDFNIRNFSITPVTKGFLYFNDLSRRRKSP